jgi:DNA-binding MarR family transcriptional regulator
MSKNGTAASATAAHVYNHCLCFAARRAARALARRFDEALAPLGLTNGQFSLMTSLDRPAPSSIGFVAALLAMDRTTLTANLKPLERQGLVTIGIDPADRRGRLLTLTKEGRRLLRLAMPVWKRTHAEIDGRLAQTDPGALRAGLRLLA